MVFLLLALLHVYWAAGGKAWKTRAVPIHKNGSAVFRPSAAATAMVALVLFLFAFMTFNNLNQADRYLSEKTNRYVLYGISTVFFFRAIGDFKFVGFTKRIKGTVFSKIDTAFYSPLCFIISFNSFMIAVL